MTPQREILAELAHLQIEYPRAVDDAAAIGLDPGEHLPHERHALDMAAGVRGRAHAVQPDTRRRRARRIDDAVPDVVKLERESLCLQRAEERREPIGVLVKNVDGGECHRAFPGAFMDVMDPEHAARSSCLLRRGTGCDNAPSSRRGCRRGAGGDEWLPAAARLDAEHERPQRFACRQGVAASHVAHAYLGGQLVSHHALVDGHRGCQPQHLKCRLAWSGPDVPSRGTEGPNPAARESFGDDLRQICQAIRQLAAAHPELDFIYPVHPNPNVQSTVQPELSALPNVQLIEPQPYDAFLQLMDRAKLILTDSGGIQEEAYSMRKPILILRRHTERMEAVNAGYAWLVGCEPARIVERAEQVLTGLGRGEDFFTQSNPFGDGKASERIVEVLDTVLTK